MNDIFILYRDLLNRVDIWFKRCMDQYGSDITCGTGCSGCCRALFDITLLDAWFLNIGFQNLPDEVKHEVRKKAEGRLRELKTFWPEWEEPYVLNVRPEEDWEVFMPEEDETPCVLLSAEGRCLVYDHRPMTCRLHGIPLVDVSGEEMHDGWCTENFIGTDPLQLQEIRFDFNTLFDDEIMLFRHFTEQLLNRRLSEVDTFIPLAVLLDFEKFDWREWAKHTALGE